jgi:hypothetical protein
VVSHISNTQHRVQCSFAGCGVSFFENHKLSGWHHDGQFHWRTCSDCPSSVHLSFASHTWVPTVIGGIQVRRCNPCGAITSL